MARENDAKVEVATVDVTESIPVKEEKKEMEETPIDGEYIKIEKEPYESKENDHPNEAKDAENIGPSAAEQSASGSSPSKELLEAHEKVKELEIELDRVAEALKNSESENSQLKNEVSVMKENVEEARKRYQDLETDHRKLQEQMIEAEQKFNSDLKSLHENLEDHVSKHNELSGVREAYDNLNLEFEDSKKKLQQLEQDLESSLSDVKKFEELHKQSAGDAESVSKKAEELERTLEAATVGAKEAEEKVASLQEELIGLQAKFAESQKLEESLNTMSVELSSKDSLIDEMFKELEQMRASELQMKEDLSAVESLFAATKEDLQKKVSELEDTELRLKKEVAAKESVEAALKSQGEIVLKSQDELAIVLAEKETLETAVSNLKDELELINKQCVDFETTLKLSDEKFSKADTLSAEVLEKNAELEQKLKSLQEKIDESKAAAEKYLQLEESFQAAHAALSERELLLDTEKHRIKELEEEVEALSKKCGDVEAESKNYYDKVSELTYELEKSRSATVSLESALETASERETALTESLNIATEEKRKLEETINDSLAKHRENDELLEVLRSELSVTQGKLESVENDLKASGIREGEFIEKLKSAEEQLVEQIPLAEKIKLLEDQIRLHEEQSAEAAGKSASLNEELNQSSAKIAALESLNEDLKSAIAVAEEKAAQSLSEISLLSETNSQLKEKVSDLEQVLESVSAEKETASLQITSHVNTISELTDQHTRSREIHSETEARLVEAEAQLKEATEKLSHKELEAKELFERLSTIEEQVRLHEEKTLEASELADCRKGELDQTRLKMEGQAKMIKELEASLGQLEAQNGALAEANIKLNEELAGYESRLSDLSKVIAERDEAFELHSSSKKMVEDLNQQLASETQQLQAKISSMTEEHRQFVEANGEACGNLQTEITDLRGKLEGLEEANEGLKSKLESMKGLAAEKSDMQARVKDLEEKLLVAESQLAKEAESGRARDALSEKKVQQLQQELELSRNTITQLKQKEANSTQLSEELEAKSQKIAVLEKQIVELEQNSRVNATISKENVEGVEVNSRDLGSNFSSPTKRKSKKSGSSSAPTQPSSESHNTTTTRASSSSSAINIKLVLGVALFSIVLGIILGKRY